MTGIDCVVVIGVARSGTSCVSGMLSRLGVDFDDGALLEATEFNPKGYFESRTLNGLLDTQIQSAKGWQGVDIGLTRGVETYLDALISEASRPFGFKDTRLVSCGVPVVAYLLDRGVNVRVVTTRRNLIANTHSLESWHKPAQAAELSSFLNQHLRRTERVLRKRAPLIQVSYEKVLLDPTREALRLAEHVGSDAGLAQFAAGFVDHSLNHHGKQGAT